MENYRIWRNKVTKLIREAKTKYYQKGHTGKPKGRRHLEVSQRTGPQK